MSSNDGDQETIELSLQLAGLSISVRGAPDRAADFVRRVAGEEPAHWPEPSVSGAPVFPGSQRPPKRALRLVQSPTRIYLEASGSEVPEFN